MGKIGKMKAFVRTGDASQEVKLSEIKVPQIDAEQVLIKVQAFGVGIHDRYFIPTEANFPYTIGSEGAGIITQIGNQVSNFKIGDRVIFTTILQDQGGTWAEYAVANQVALIPLPDNLTFTQGAAIPIAGKTALECMRSLDLDKGDKLFIAGASGAVGTFVIQLAVAKGVHVSASASEKNHLYMKSLGAEKTVDYNDPDWRNVIKQWSNGGVNAALAIQPGTGTGSLKVVKNGGKLITVSGDHNEVVAERAIIIKQLEHHQETQLKVIDLVNSISAGKIKVVIEKEYPFSEALDALKKTETRHARGKSIVKYMN